ncbi:hypothetical protein pdam_00003158 [Pocillopora damicornis]|uniref:Uncharacterized protein n=1 Tax=Pocillopora damicornis TaxID=46731 RepID=A0A3M6UAV4_POCDA|nr:hypothetical protein pdam_00003158 [Pocillopora damicornis]
MVLKRKVATVGGKKLSIQDVFDECKSAAEKKGFKIFGIRRQMLKRAAKVAKRARSEIGYVKFIRMTPFDGMME